MEFGLKWVHMAWYELILRLDGALWLTIIFKPLLTPKRAIKIKFESYLGMFVTEKVSMIWNVAARALATYLIPGCVGRGVRLGSEGSSVGGGVGGGGGVWKSRCFGQNKNFRFLTHNRDLGAILPPN